MAGIAAVAAGSFSAAEPAGWLPADVAVRAASAALVALVASRARRWTWVAVPAAAAAMADSLVWAGVAGIGLALGIVVVAMNIRRRWMGAAAAALAAQTLLHLPDPAFEGSSAVAVAAVVGVLSVSAYRAAPRPARRRAQIGVAAALAVFVVAAIVAGGSALLAQNEVEDAIVLTRQGLREARAGDLEDAALFFEEAAAGFDAGNALVSAWWVAPARAVPLVGQHVRALDVSTEEGAALANAAHQAVVVVDPEQFTWEDGRLDLDLVRAAQAPLQASSDALVRAGERLADVATPWLASPVASRVDRLRTEIAGAQPDALLAAEAARLAPALLGGEGTRRYFVIFTTPSESRGLGGFMGSWAELEADDGALRLTESGRTRELNEASAPGLTLQVPDTEPAATLLGDYVRRYAPFDPVQTMQDITLSPDFPTVALAMEQLYPLSGGQAVDGVLVVDPYALAALMEFTGPIELEGMDEPLTADTAADFLLRDQYIRFPAQTQRVDFLEEASRRTFESLTSGDLPAPKKIADTLAPMVHQGRLAFHAADSGEQALFELAGIDGSMAEVGPVDALTVVTQNAGNNKLDAYLHRTIDYRVTADGSSGLLTANLSVTLSNELPTLDLPGTVVNNNRGYPPGTNDLHLSVYTPLLLRGATLDGQDVAVGSAVELGRRVYTVRLPVAMGEERTVELQLTGEVGAFDRYDLSYGAQALVNTDRVRVEVTADGRQQLTDGLWLRIGADRRTALFDAPVADDRHLSVDLR